VIAALALLPLQAPASGLEPDPRIVALHADAEAAERIVLRGRDGWLYFRPELRFLSIGRFWGEDAARVGRAARPEDADPLPAILDFHEQLARAGIRLVLVPVPAKATIHPEPLVADGEGAGQRNDRALAAFLSELATRGVLALDLVPVFRAEARADPLRPLYCRTDTHWSPRGIAVAAREIAAFLAAQGLAEPHATSGAMTRVAITLDGDLRQLARDEGLALEPLSVEQPPGGPFFERESPIVLLGDSHVLVFSAGGDMHAEGAGLGEHLAWALGRPLDRVGVRGSGATAPRINLLQRRDDLRGKRLVLWVFGVRDLTETDGWRRVPVIRAPEPK
jgi:alginate O-acetyltransferase complex protein AlgJ